MSGKIETMADWNALLGQCGRCLMPTAGAPVMVCESMSGRATSADDEYTDRVEKYEKKLHDWLAEPIDEWFKKQAKWLEENPDKEPGDYPIPPPTPREDENFPDYPGPQMPEGYIDVAHGSFGPFTRPKGDPDDDMPVIYREFDSVLKDLVNGTGNALISVDTSEYLVVTNVSDNIESYTESGHEWDGVNCTVMPQDGAVGGAVGWGGVTFEMGDYEFKCTAVSQTITREGTSKQGNLPLELKGCPGPFPTKSEEAWDFTRKESEQYTVAKPVTKAEIGNKAKSKIGDKWPKEPLASGCIASLLFTWPRIRDGYTDGKWPGCDFALGIKDLGGVATANRVRFRWRIPFSHKGTYFKITWDVLTISKKWVEWKARYVAHEAWKVEKKAWDKLPVKDRPAEPVEPAKPGVRPEVPTLDRDHTVEWHGPGTGKEEDNDPSWLAGDYQILQPPDFEGWRYVVNVRFIPYRSPWGVKPQTTGIGFDLKTEIPSEKPTNP